MLDVSLMLAYLPQKGVTPKGVEDVEEFNFEVAEGTEEELQEDGRYVCVRVHVCVCSQRRGLGLFLAA